MTPDDPAQALFSLQVLFRVFGWTTYVRCQIGDDSQSDAGVGMLWPIREQSENLHERHLVVSCDII